MLLDILNRILLAPEPTKPWWQDAGWIGVGVAILVGIGGFILWWVDHRRQNKRRAITYQIISDTPIANINEEVKDRVEIQYDGKPVKDMSLVVLKIWNKGGIAVRREDYDEPIRFELTGRTYVTGEVLNREPEELIKQEDLKDFLRLQPDGNVELPRFLLNPLEAVSIKMLVVGQGKIKGLARIIDGKLTETQSAEQLRNVEVLPALALIFTILALIMFSSYFSSYSNSMISIIFKAIYLLLVFLVSALTTIFIYSKNALYVNHKIKFKWW